MRAGASPMNRRIAEMTPAERELIWQNAQLRIHIDNRSRVAIITRRILQLLTITSRERATA